MNSNNLDKFFGLHCVVSPSGSPTCYDLRPYHRLEKIYKRFVYYLLAIC